MSEAKTPAQESLEAFKAAIATMDPTFQMEIKYVEDRLFFLMQRYGEPAVCALMKAALQITVDKGQ